MKNWKTFLVIGIVGLAFYCVYLAYQQLQAFENKANAELNGLQSAMAAFGNFLLNPLSTVAGWITGNSQTQSQSDAQATSAAINGALNQFAPNAWDVF